MLTFTITEYQLTIILTEGWNKDHFVFFFLPQEHSLCQKHFIWNFFRTPHNSKILLSKTGFKTVKNVSMKDWREIFKPHGPQWLKGIKKPDSAEIQMKQYFELRKWESTMYWTFSPLLFLYLSSIEILLDSNLPSSCVEDSMFLAIIHSKLINYYLRCSLNIRINK